MSNLTSHLIQDFTSASGRDHDALAAVRNLTNKRDLDTLGHTDLVPSLDEMRVGLQDQTYHFKRQYVIESGDVIVGSVWVHGGLKDNQHLAHVDVLAHPSDPEVFAFGYALADQVAAEEGRSALNAYIAHTSAEPKPEDPNYLASPTGIGAVDTSGAHTATLLASGWVLEQTERYSMLQLPVPESVVKPLEDAAAAKASDYELVQWVNITPEEYLEGQARLFQAMSTDVPSAGLEIEATVFDGARVRHFESQVAARGRQFLTVAAVHKESGELAGFTRVEFSEDNPESVIQEETLVLSPHRGHSLGMWLKAKLVQEIVKIRPHAARIHTWNAGENEHMLAINVALGFTQKGIEAAWQKKLS